MKKDHCEYIKKCVLENIAFANYGRVTLSQIYRLFSDYGSLRDLEKCLDTFVKDGVAEKQIDEGVTIYVFKEIATKFEKRWKEQLNNLLTQKNMLSEKRVKKEMEVKAANELYNIWREGWKNIKDKKLEHGIKNFISNYWKCVIDRQVNELKVIENEINILTERIKTLEKLLGTF